MIDIPCVILSGGKSSRMGEDKSLLSFKNHNTLIEFQYNKLSKIFKNLYISSKTDKFEFLKNKSQIIYDESQIYSPMIALKSILQNLNSKKVFIITVDNPFISEQTIEKLLLNSINHDITLAQSKDKLHNLCGVFSVDLLDNITKYIKEDMHKINFLVRNSHTIIIDFPDENEFFNINTKEDYTNSHLLPSNV